MMGVDGPQLYNNFLKPRIKVGNEFVTQGRNVTQVSITLIIPSSNCRSQMYYFPKKRDTGALLGRCHGQGYLRSSVQVAGQACERDFGNRSEACPVHRCARYCRFWDLRRTYLFWLTNSELVNIIVITKRQERTWWRTETLMLTLLHGFLVHAP